MYSDDFNNDYNRALRKNAQMDRLHAKQKFYRKEFLRWGIVTTLAVCAAASSFGYKTSVAAKASTEASEETEIPVETTTEVDTLSATTQGLFNDSDTVRYKNVSDSPDTIRYSGSSVLYIHGTFNNSGNDFVSDSGECWEDLPDMPQYEENTTGTLVLDSYGTVSWDDDDVITSYPD